MTRLSSIVMTRLSNIVVMRLSTILTVLRLVFLVPDQS